MTIDRIIGEIKSHKIFRHRLLIVFQYQSVYWHRLLSIDIDYYRLSASSIDHAGHRSNLLLGLPARISLNREIYEKSEDWAPVFAIVMAARVLLICCWRICWSCTRVAL